MQGFRRAVDTITYEYPNANECKHRYKATDILKTDDSVNMYQLERSRNDDYYYRVLSVASISILGTRCRLNVKKID